MAVPKNPRELERAEPFASLFPVQPETLRAVTASMRERGFDPHHPVLAWRDAFGERGRTVIVDGHTRSDAATAAGLAEVQVTLRRFEDVDAAVAAAIEEQAQRRNLSSSQIAVYVLRSLDALGDGSRGAGARNDLRGRSASQLAAMLSVGTRTVERARKLIDCGDGELLAQVQAGELSLKAAEARIRRGGDAGPIPGQLELEHEDEPELEPDAPEPEPASDEEPPPGSIAHQAASAAALPSGEPEPAPQSDEAAQHENRATGAPESPQEDKNRATGADREGAGEPELEPDWKDDVEAALRAIGVPGLSFDASEEDNLLVLDGDFVYADADEETECPTWTVRRLKDGRLLLSPEWRDWRFDTPQALASWLDEHRLRQIEAGEFVPWSEDDD